MMELTGSRLDRAIAVALGWAVEWSEEENAAIATLHGGRIRTNRPFLNVSKENLIEGLWDSVAERFHADANPQLELCAEYGWTMRHEIDDSDPRHKVYVVWIEADEPPEHTGRSDNNWQEAGARAILAAVQK